MMVRHNKQNDAMNNAQIIFLPEPAVATTSLAMLHNGKTPSVPLLSFVTDLELTLYNRS